ncbi:MAG TPA: hypothetical protein VN455_01415, partial [Methanotrichaceae archaeon]|nr:hypothetical protein [Methanotrichaceae archaeon]
LSKNIKEVEILDYQNPEDKIWQENLNNPLFKSDACGGAGIISLFKQSEVNPELLAHESGHLLDGVSGSKSKGQISDSPEWAKAIESDGRDYEHKGFVSDYAASHGSKQEDLADSVSQYMNFHKTFTKKYPNRAAILDKHLMKDIETTERHTLDALGRAIT